MGATMSSSAVAPSARYYFCHRCFLATVLAAGAACPLCGGAFVEEINIPPSEAPNLNPNRSFFFTTGCLSTSPASFVLRCRADADAFFRSEISPLGHLTRYPTRRPPFPLAYLEASIDHLLARGSRVYVVLAGAPPPAGHAGSDLTIGRLAGRINLQGRDRDIFTTPAARGAIAALRDIEINAGPQGGQSCMVCLETLEVGTVAKRFPCKHVFHKECITEWLRQQHTCPVCRFPLLTEEVGGPSHTVFRVVIPPLSSGLNLDRNIVVLDQEVRGQPQTPPCRWA
ncbi:E3 ubiquitin-protein ligase RING1-like [Ananas comosus]|uniref:E3 ubiquitin-protein ligase RING1-like n=1 Tax=Ananas comosus TaxID=4615 RepID=A0A199UU86_ANACO|nr:E3 ubiquitin-protein ligase RING1-like [Ananas comosus]